MASRMAAKGKKKKRGKVVGKRPPAGYYDPALDAALDAARRGLGDMRADYGRDFGATGTAGRVGTDYRLGLEDLARERHRGLTDIATGELRTRLDRNTAMANVARQYAEIARRQAEGAAAAGVQSEGLLGQAAEVRAKNKSLDEQPILTSFARQMQDFGQARSRLVEDHRLGAAQLGLDYQRTGEDAETALSRAARETSQFGLDTQAARLHQATQAGYVPPRRPRRRRGGSGGSSGASSVFASPRLVQQPNPFRRGAF